MKRFVEGVDRGRSTLFPECLEDWIGEDNPVRVIDIFVEELDLAELGFERVRSCYGSDVTHIQHKPATGSPSRRAAGLTRSPDRGHLLVTRQIANRCGSNPRARKGPLTCVLSRLSNIVSGSRTTLATLPSGKCASASACRHVGLALYAPARISARCAVRRPHKCTPLASQRYRRMGARAYPDALAAW